MNWLLKYLDQKAPQMGSEAIDCDRCQVHQPLSRPEGYSPEKKCCAFSPFVSAFALGALLRDPSSTSLLDAVGPDLIWTPLGVLHSLKHRTHSGALCNFYSQGECQIWSQRPATCFSFFCAGTRHDVESRFESWAMERESNLVKAWFEHLQLDDVSWQQWIDLMEESPKRDMPKALIITDRAEAFRLYQDSDLWLNSYSHSGLGHVRK